MTLESVLAFALALLVWVFIPGPAIFAIAGRSLTAGMKPTLVFISGIMLGDVFYMSVALFGMAAIGRVLGDFFYLVRLFGAAYLIFLGAKLWLSAPNLHHGSASNKPADQLKSFLSGFSLTLGNPKAILFHLGFLPTFFDLATIRIWDGFVIILIFLTILGTSLSLYAYGASRARLFFSDAKKIRILNRGAGAILMGTGIVLITRKN